jgi:amino acid transporter
MNWKQGLVIALGVPLLILPSIGYTASYLWGAAILLWGLSVFQGFMQNIAYGELATAFPKASGLPGFAQAVFSRKKGTNKKYDKGMFVGGFSAWGYWFAWCPVLAIFSLTIGSYLSGLVPELEDFSAFQLSLIAGLIIFAGLTIINSRGLAGSARSQLILAVFSLIPLIVIAVAPFFTGDFKLSNITDSWMPTDWNWGWENILILLGLFAIAQWSACAWETAAIYGPYYKKPGSDVPKALFSCGIICLFTFVFIQMSATGTLGVDGILAEPVSPLLPVAELVFGDAGSMVLVIMLIAAMVLIIQTAFLGSSQAMKSMADEGNLPRFLGKVNSKNVPVRAMVLIAVFNVFLITLKTPTAILAASAIGYVCANSISLFSFVKARRDPELAKLDRPFKAPKFWTWIALAFALFNIPACLIGVMYLNGLEFGWTPILVGVIVLACYIPLWWFSQRQNHVAIPIDVGGDARK